MMRPTARDDIRPIEDHRDYLLLVRLQLGSRPRAKLDAHAVARLPEDQRRVVELHYLKGLAVADVAEQIGRTRPAAVGLLFRGLKRLPELPRETRESGPG